MQRNDPCRMIIVRSTGAKFSDPFRPRDPQLAYMLWLAHGVGHGRSRLLRRPREAMDGPCKADRRPETRPDICRPGESSDADGYGGRAFVGTCPYRTGPVENSAARKR